MSVTVDRAALEAAGAEAALARLHLIDFCELVLPGWKPAPHLRELAKLLEAVETGELLRLIVSLFPGSGKSTFRISGVGRVVLGKESASKNNRDIGGSRTCRTQLTRHPRTLHARTVAVRSKTIAGDDPRRIAGIRAMGAACLPVGAGRTVTGWRAGTKGASWSARAA